jgi:hypothetical protein
VTPQSSSDVVKAEQVPIANEAYYGADKVVGIHATGLYRTAGAPDLELEPKAVIGGQRGEIVSAGGRRLTGR